MRKTPAVFALIAAALVLPAAPAQAAFMAPDTACSASMGAVEVPGKLVVPAGATCTLTGTVIRAGVEVGIGSTLNATGISVAAGLHASQAASVSVSGNSAIQGHAKMLKGGTASIANSTAFGGLEIAENTGAVTVTGVGSANADIFIRKNRGGVTVNTAQANGNFLVLENSGGLTTVHNSTALDGFKVENNSGGASVQYNVAWDNLEVNKNLGGTQIIGNRSDDNITCIDNAPAPTGHSNVAGADGNGAMSGQCLGL
ncbi:hypothetical protein [Sinosporangium siamense]|uniref:Right-handed parallel beta-helix repeat-containing protein n=1 Tax=Sinosporangium siamense TaxID=1367973 RepID=A0A919RKG3_9ACTN|nr:hypothetical protein [Sinosporangium siamense]GII95258.1 hypothetical protein Ssi02_54890 [Sinosporangium siamense]